MNWILFINNSSAILALGILFLGSQILKKQLMRSVTAPGAFV